MRAKNLIDAKSLDRNRIKRSSTRFCFHWARCRSPRRRTSAFAVLTCPRSSRPTNLVSLAGGRHDYRHMRNKLLMCYSLHSGTFVVVVVWQKVTLIDDENLHEIPILKANNVLIYDTHRFRGRRGGLLNHNLFYVQLKNGRQAY